MSWLKLRVRESVFADWRWEVLTYDGSVISSGVKRTDTEAQVAAIREAIRISRDGPRKLRSGAIFSLH
jgi:hypothetical protein